MFEFLVAMPRNKGKKKKGKIVTPSMGESVKKQMLNSLNKNMGGALGGGLKVPESGTQTAATDSNSALDAS